MLGFVSRMPSHFRSFCSGVIIESPIFFFFLSHCGRSAVEAKGISVLASISSYLVLITQAFVPENTLICVIICLNIIQGGYNKILQSHVIFMLSLFSDYLIKPQRRKAFCPLPVTGRKSDRKNNSHFCCLPFCHTRKHWFIYFFSLTRSWSLLWLPAFEKCLVTHVATKSIS